ncbi:MAG: hypothetical protein GWN00_00160, partial [Aliifodinibius sp.]|nr:hypothetical protein [Phycisphaerae bacterium]NIT54696.1 hypothetical protein [Fodinibius sp.]NIW97580.1 hypothetical protein [Phycisphaerae bacterium]NIY23280.1 hypothetical protein [Fodinibius sp.]
YLDGNLALAHAQGDVGHMEFMETGYFDTNGSFELAMAYLNDPELQSAYAEEKRQDLINKGVPYAVA